MNNPTPGPPQSLSGVLSGVFCALSQIPPMKIRQLILEAKKDLTMDQLMTLEEAVINTQRSGSLASRVMRQALPIPVILVSTGFVLVCV